jgi:hypothetical protein
VLPLDGLLYLTAAYAASERTSSTSDVALRSDYEYRYIRGQKKGSLGKEGKGHKEQGNGGKREGAKNLGKTGAGRKWERWMR